MIAAADAVATAQGLHPGMTLAQAQAMVPGLVVREADPAADAAALQRLAWWCLRYAPLVSTDPPDGIWPNGIWIDVTGTAHLHGGETALLRDLTSRLLAQGLNARAAIADTPGAAHAVARFGKTSRGASLPYSHIPAMEQPLPLPLREGVGGRGFAQDQWDFPPPPGPHPQGGGERFIRTVLDPMASECGRVTPGGTPITIVPVQAHAAALANLPIESLRLPSEIAEGLRLLGIETVGKLATLPRAPLARRFGALLATRLDQALGAVFEPIVPSLPPDLPQARLTFVEPLLTAEAFATVIARLTAMICEDLEKSGQGARRLDLLFERVDGSIQSIRIGTARPSRDARHLARMLDERLERVDPGLGVEAMHLVVPHTDALAYAQSAVRLTETGRIETDISPLMDRLANRLGAERVYRNAPVESDVPERSVRRIPALAPPGRMTGKAPGTPFGVAPAITGRMLPARPHIRRLADTSGTSWETPPGHWPADLPRPVRLLDPPQPVDAMALLPDHPPIAFTWRRVRHRVRHADGPERIAGEWWKRDGEMRSVRDYFRVEDEEGRRYWLFRRGDGADSVTGDMRWFLHGFF